MPIGANAGVIDLPITLRTEFSESSLPKVKSVLMEFRKLNAITTTTIVFPARRMKDFNRNQVVSNILRVIGT